MASRPFCVNDNGCVYYANSLVYTHSSCDREVSPVSVSPFPKSPLLCVVVAMICVHLYIYIPYIVISRQPKESIHGEMVQGATLERRHTGAQTLLIMRNDCCGCVRTSAIGSFSQVVESSLTFPRR
jgi:hypothetical protein